MAPSRGWFFSPTPEVVAGGNGLAPLAFRGAVTNNAGSVSSITMTTPTETVVGDLMFFFVCAHTGISDVSVYPDDFTDGWTFFDGMTEYNAGQDHLYAIYWKLAESGDAGGSGSYQFNLRNNNNTADVTDSMDGVIAAFSGVQDPATDMDFLYNFDHSEVSASGTSIIFGNMPFDVAPEGDGLLVCFVNNDSAASAITSPAEMTEDVNFTGGAHSMVITTETISPSSGDVGPKEFSQGSAIDYMGVSFILKPRATDGRFGALYTYPKFRDIGNRYVDNFGSVGKITVTPPSGTEEGDLLVMILTKDFGADFGIAVPDVNPTSQGWTTLYDQNNFNDIAGAAWWKIATADDASTAPDEILLDWEATLGVDQGSVYIYRVGGVTYPTDEGFIGLLGSAILNGSLLTGPSFTTPYDNCLVIHAISHKSVSQKARRDHAPRGAGKIVDYHSGPTNTGPSIFITVEGVPFAGPGGGGTMRWDDAQKTLWFSFYIALDADA